MFANVVVMAVVPVPLTSPESVIDWLPLIKLEGFVALYGVKPSAVVTFPDVSDKVPPSVSDPLPATVPVSVSPLTVPVPLTEVTVPVLDV